MTEADRLLVVTLFSMIVAPVLAVAGKRAIERLMPLRKDLSEEIERLWKHIAALEKKNGELEGKLDDCTAQHRAAVVRNDELARELERLACQRGICPVAS